MAKALFISLFFLSALSPGGRLPGFVLRDVNGTVVYKSDLCGSRQGGALIIDFFATWCKPCIKAIEVLKNIKRRFKSNELKIVLIAFRQKPGEIKAFFKKKGVSLPFPVLSDPYGEVADAFGVASIPRTFIVDAEKCQVNYIIFGERSDLREVLEGQIKKILKKEKRK